MITRLLDPAAKKHTPTSKRAPLDKDSIEKANVIIHKASILLTNQSSKIRRLNAILESLKNLDKKYKEENDKRWFSSPSQDPKRPEQIKFIQSVATYFNHTKSASTFFLSSAEKSKSVNTLNILNGACFLVMREIEIATQKSKSNILVKPFKKTENSNLYKLLKAIVGTKTVSEQNDSLAAFQAFLLTDEKAKADIKFGEEGFEGVMKKLNTYLEPSEPTAAAGCVV